MWSRSCSRRRSVHVVGELVGPDLSSIGVAQRIEMPFVVPTVARRVSQLGNFDEVLAGEGPRPGRTNCIQRVRLMGEQLKDVVAHTGPYTEQPFELIRGSAVDCDPLIAAIDDLNEGIRPLDDVSQQPALGEGLGDARFERFVELLERLLGPFARRDVLEQYRDLALAGRLDPECGELEMAPGGDQLALEPDRVSAQQHAAVELDPSVRFARHHFAHLLAHHVGDAGMARIGCVGLDVNVVAERTERPIEKLDDAKALVDGVEEGLIAPLAACEGLLALAALPGDGRLEASVLRFQRLHAAPKPRKVVLSHYCRPQMVFQR